MDTDVVEATGMISKIFPGQKNRSGLMRILTPLSLRGEQLTFFSDDLELSPREKQYLSPGMMMSFTVDSSRAVKVKPMPVAEYQGSVVRGPQARASGHGFVVTLEPTLARAKISADSYNQLKLEKPPRPGDFCTVRIPWTEMLLAAEENRMILADIVSLIRRPPRVSASLGETLDSDEEALSLDSPSEIHADLRSCGSHSDTYDDDERPSSADSIPRYEYENTPRLRHRQSFNRSHRASIPMPRPNMYPPIIGHYEDYDHFVRATLRRPFTPHMQEAHRGLTPEESRIPMNYPVGGICRPMHVAIPAFPSNYQLLPFNCQGPYQYPQTPFAMHCAHGHIH